MAHEDNLEAALVNLRVLRGLRCSYAAIRKYCGDPPADGGGHRRAGRRRSEIALMAVTKTHPPEHIREAYDAGLRLFGENRVQEFAGKAAALADLPDADWHMIGHLQTNKAAKAAELFSAVDSVDSVKLAEKLDAAARNLGKNCRVLIEINVGGEAAKSGVAPGSPNWMNFFPPHRGSRPQFRGLMTVPPFTDDPEGARPYFRKLRELRDTIAARKLPNVGMDVLSMGMSHDFEVAIEEGRPACGSGRRFSGHDQSLNHGGHPDKEKNSAMAILLGVSPFRYVSAVSSGENNP